MDKEYFGYYKELNKWRFDKILNIKKEDLGNYEFIVLKTNDYIVPPSERYGAINHRYFLQILDTELNRKTITSHNWSLVSKMSTNSAFTPSSLYVSMVDRFGKELNKTVKFNWVSLMDSIFEIFEELEKFHDISHYVISQENTRLKKQLQRANDQSDYLLQENKECLEELDILKKKLKTIKEIIKDKN